jgi:hypothetical protein
MLKRTLSAAILAAALLTGPAIVPSYAQEPAQTGQHIVRHYIYGFGFLTSGVQE